MKLKIFKNIADYLNLIVTTLKLLLKKEKKKKSFFQYAHM